MRTNLKTRHKFKTHEGGTAVYQKPMLELTRAVSSCMLFENTFYEKGSDIADRIASLCNDVVTNNGHNDLHGLELIGSLAVTARNDLKLRHVPLWLAVQMVRINSTLKIKSDIPSQVLFEVIQRPDELAEALSLYWKANGKRVSLAAQLKKGLALAFTKFNEYQLAKWNRDGDIKLRDVLFLCHAEPESEKQALLWKQLIDGTLAVPDTWETNLSSGADKGETFERLLQENKLGYMALLMNLRNMEQSGVDHKLVAQRLIEGAGNSRALPFRFLTAFRHAPRYGDALNTAMLSMEYGTLPGTTFVVVDHSGSMNYGNLSGKSEGRRLISRELTRADAAGAMAVLVRQMCEDCRIFTFSNQVAEVQNVRGIPLVQAIDGSMPWGGTYLAGAMNAIKQRYPNEADRIIIITDEQSHDGYAPCWADKGYLINVAGYKPGLDVSQGWTRISGWSERICEWIQFEENQGAG